MSRAAFRTTKFPYFHIRQYITQHTMDFMDSLSGMASRVGPRSFESLLKFTDLSPAVQRHMQQVWFVAMRHG